MTNLPALPGHALQLVFIQLAVLLAAARLLGEAAKRLDQPPVIGELLAGIVLGPSLLGWLAPGFFAALFPPVAAQMHLLELVAWLGMALLLFVTGYDTDIRLLRHLGRAAATASVFGMVVPFAAGFACGEVLPAAYLADPTRRHLFSAFLATAMAISAMPVIAKILMDLGLTKRNLGVVILSAGVVDDTTGWLILSVIAGVAGSGGFSPLSFGRTLLGTGLFLAVAAWVAFPALKWAFRFIDDRFRSRGSDLTLIVIVTFVAAAATDWIGIHAVFGAFVAGCLLRQVPRLRPHTAHRLEGVVLNVFAPIFFGLVGLKVDLGTIRDPSVLALVLGVAVGGKVLGCTLGGLAGGLGFWESLSIGTGMNARGAMGLVVALLGLTLGILNQQMYSIIVTVAVATSFMAPITLRWTSRRVKMTSEERARLAADAEQRLFDPRALRALVPTAGGPNALAAARFGACLARGDGATLTALYVEQKSRGLLRRITGRLKPDLAGRNLQQHLALLRARAEARGVRFEIRTADGGKQGGPGEIIRREAERGADLLLLGAGPHARQALRGDLIGALTDRAPCHVAIVRADGRREAGLTEGADAREWRRVLVPFDGSYFSRAAVELAVLYAETAGAVVTVLYVMEGEDAPAGDDEGDSALDDHARRMLATTMMASISPVVTQTSARVDVIVREADQLTAPVLAEAQKQQHDLLVVGVESRAVQHRLSVGYDVERLIEECPCSVIVVVPRIGGGASPE